MSRITRIFAIKKKKDMEHFGERYINPLTDFGFKRIFGTPFNSDLLVDFLNAVLAGEHVITDLSYNFDGNESMSMAVFDAYCTTEDGTHIIVEMQNLYHGFFQYLTIYYIVEQAKEKNWDCEPNNVYIVGIMNFTFPEDKKSDDCVFKEEAVIGTIRNNVFYDKFTYIYVELTNFHKTLEECETVTDKWLYCLNNLQKLQECPDILQGSIFEQLFNTTEIDKFTPLEVKGYEQSVKAYRDIKNGIDAAKAEGERIGMAMGMAEGRKKGMQQGIKEGLQQCRKERIEDMSLNLARKMRSLGVADDIIIQVTGLSKEKIARL